MKNESSHITVALTQNFGNHPDDGHGHDVSAGHLYQEFYSFDPKSAKAWQVWYQQHHSSALSIINTSI